MDSSNAHTLHVGDTLETPSGGYLRVAEGSGDMSNYVLVPVNSRDEPLGSMGGYFHGAAPYFYDGVDLRLNGTLIPAGMLPYRI